MHLLVFHKFDRLDDDDDGSVGSRFLQATISRISCRESQFNSHPGKCLERPSLLVLSSITIIDTCVFIMQASQQEARCILW